MVALVGSNQKETKIPLGVDGKGGFMKMWSQTDEKSKITATCNYLIKSHQYEVIVSNEHGKEKRKQIDAMYEPRFGMDVIDSNNCYLLAEELAQELEKE